MKFVILALLFAVNTAMAATVTYKPVWNIKWFWRPFYGRISSACTCDENGVLSDCPDKHEVKCVAEVVEDKK